MDKNCTRRSFVSMTTVGIAGALLGSSPALAETVSNKNSASYDATSSTHTKKLRPNLRVMVTDVDSGQIEMLDSSRVKVASHSDIYDDTTKTGSTECTVDIYSNPTTKHSGGIATHASNSGEYSDVIGSISLKAIWTLSSNKKKINLTRIEAVFNQKKGTLTKRHVSYKNGDGGKRFDNVALNFKKDINDGYQPVGADRDLWQFVNAWATATAAGMGGSKEITCYLTYGE